MEFSELPQPFGLLTLMLIFLAQLIFKGENSIYVIFKDLSLILACVDTFVQRFVSNLE